MYQEQYLEIKTDLFGQILILQMKKTHVRIVDNMSNSLIEYIKLHRLSISQDLDLIEDNEMNFVREVYPKEYLQGAIACMDHILEVANEGH